VSRWAGADRVATSSEVVRRTASNPSVVLVVGARDHRDALAAGPAAALAGGTSLLVEPVSGPSNGSALTLLSTIAARSVILVDGAQSVSYTVAADLGIWR
jgi:putative cell wall-binding protein